MNALNKWTSYSFGIVAILLSLAGGYYLRKVVLIGTAYKANEDYTNPLEDVIFMLMCTGDVAAYAAKKPLEIKPGSEQYK